MNLTILVIHTLLLFGFLQNAESAKRNATAEKHLQAKEATITNVAPQSSRKAAVIVKNTDTTIPLVDTADAINAKKQKPQN